MNNGTAKRRNRENALVLGILDAVGNRKDLTQRHLAVELGVALGLANSYLKRCIRKGLVKVKHAPANRYLYYLTPSGFAEKSRLTAEYLSASFEYYNRAGESVVAALNEIKRANCRAALLAGRSELAEIAAIRSLDVPLAIVGTFEPNTGSRSFLGKPVYKSLNDAPFFDAVLLTSIEHANSLFDVLQASEHDSKVYVPTILASTLATSG